MNFQYRNWQKRIIFEDAVYFVTVKTYNNFPFFKERIFCGLFVENLQICKRLKQFQLYGWVLIYDHFHLLVQPNDKWNVSNVMFSIKKQFSHDVNRIMGFNKSYPHLKVGKRLPTFRGDERLIITNHQKYINSLSHKFIQKHKNKNPFPKFKWQDRFHDHYIRNNWDFNDKLDYIAYNSQKHGLPNNWMYISTNPKYNNLTDGS